LDGVEIDGKTLMGAVGSLGALCTMGDTNCWRWLGGLMESSQERIIGLMEAVVGSIAAMVGSMGDVANSMGAVVGSMGDVGLMMRAVGGSM
jgi:hypothetical protein